MGEDTVLGGETTCLLDLPSAGLRPSSVYARQLLNGGHEGYSPIENGLGEDRQEGEGPLTSSHGRENFVIWYSISFPQNIPVERFVRRLGFQFRLASNLPSHVWSFIVASSILRGC